MQEKRIENRITSIPIDKLITHPDNPNRMGKRNFARLVRNIERTGRYEPLIVRPQGDCFQIINGHNRWLTLKQLGYETVDVVVWDLDDAEADILLCSLNRLRGSDVLARKRALLDKINHNINAREMAKLLPFTRLQIEKFKNLKVPSAPAKIDAKSFAVPMVFFLNTDQQQIVEQALSTVTDALAGKTKAVRNAAALTEIAKCFVRKDKQDED